jgi:hypothetical protein
MELAGETLGFIPDNPITNTAEAFSSPLKLPAAGRQNSALSSKDDGSKVYLWTKEDNNYLIIDSSKTEFLLDTQDLRLSVRCIKDVEYYLEDLKVKN